MMVQLVSRLQRHAAATAALLLAAVFCWLAARWTWVFVAPQPMSAPLGRAAVADSIEPILNAHLFGGQGGNAPGAQPLTALQLKLRGVFAAGAIINAGAKDDAFRIGDAVLPGVVLESVASDHVLLRRQGALERLALDEKAKAANLLTVSPGRSHGAGQP